MSWTPKHYTPKPTRLIEEHRHIVYYSFALCCFWIHYYWIHLRNSLSMHYLMRWVRFALQWEHAKGSSLNSAPSPRVGSRVTGTTAASCVKPSLKTSRFPMLLTCHRIYRRSLCRALYNCGSWPKLRWPNRSRCSWFATSRRAASCPSRPPPATAWWPNLLMT